MRVYTPEVRVVRGAFCICDKGLDSIHRKEAKRANAHAHKQTVMRRRQFETMILYTISNIITVRKILGSRFI
jgi:hypothetical protein